jgi:hypothetical protein
MNFLIIQGFIGKLQAHEERINKTQEDVGAKHFFQNKIALYIPKG